MTFSHKKLILGYKYVRFKTLLRPFCQEISVKDALNLRSNQLAQILDCTPTTARLIAIKNKSVLTMSYEDFVRNAQFCKKHLKMSDVIEFPLIATNSGFLHHRYFSLMELGFRDVSGRDIFQYQALLKKSPKDLRKESYNISYNNSLEHFAQFSQEYEFTKSNEVTLKLKKLYEVDNNLQLIKESMNTEYISYKFNCSIFRVQQLFRMYPPLKCQSILITARLLDVLHKDYQMPDSKIFQSPSILSLHNESARSLLQNMPFILGVKTLEVVKKFPLMLRQSSDRVKQVENVLKNYNITDEHLLCCPRILAFSPSTVKKRLHYLCNSESFLSMKSQKKFLWLVYHNKNVIPRLDALKAIDRPFSISVFMMTNTNFEKFLKFGTCRQTHNKDVFQYLANVLNLKETEVVLKLQEFPGSQNATIKNCIQVIKYLLRAGVTKKQIFNGLGVIIYDFEVVKFYFEDLPTRSAFQPFSDWTSHYNLIQLLIYAIEVDSGYKGSKVYGPRMKSEYAEKFAACLR